MEVSGRASTIGSACMPGEAEVTGSDQKYSFYGQGIKSNLCVGHANVEREEPVGVTADDRVVADDREAQHCRPEEVNRAIGQ